MVDKTRIALIFGGESSEHGISCLTAASVMEAIDKEQFEVVGIGISPTGRWSQVPLEIVTSYRIVEGLSLVGSEMCIRDRGQAASSGGAD